MSPDNANFFFFITSLAAITFIMVFIQTPMVEESLIWEQKLIYDPDGRMVVDITYDKTVVENITLNSSCDLATTIETKSINVPIYNKETFVDYGYDLYYKLCHLDSLSESLGENSLSIIASHLDVMGVMGLLLYYKFTK